LYGALFLKNRIVPVTETRKYFIQQYSQQVYQHGGIGYVDAEKILLAQGYIPILFPHQDDFSFKAKVNRFTFLLRTITRVKKGSVVVFLFPVYAAMNRMLIRLLSRKGVRLVCFLTDINGLKDGNPALLAREIRFFGRCHYFIVHNDSMNKWLKDQLPRAHSASIEFFDFLAKGVTSVSSFSFDIVFAGNLEKSLFLEKLSEVRIPGTLLKFHLYGPGCTEKMRDQEGVEWHGIIDPYDLPLRLKGAFGLLWDGDSADKLSGSLGDYMQYISHHKLSLYIISRLPVIVPCNTAAAKLVEKYKIGFCVDSLLGIEEKLKAMSPQEYLQMQNNMAHLAQKISKGECLKEALGSFEF
jgi:hypothetical protein